MEKNPVTRFRNWIERNGWWNEEEESHVRNKFKKEVKINIAKCFKNIKIIVNNIDTR